MSQYEAQLIVEFLHGKDDEYIHHGSGALQAKFEMERFVDCEIIRVNREDKDFSSLQARLKKLSENSRFYLCGHGNSIEKTIGGRGAKDVAGVLGKDFKIKRISIVSCQLADCGFAKELFEELGSNCVKTLTARKNFVSIVNHATLDAKENPLWKPVLDSGAKAGQKRISLDDKTPVQDTKSKLQGSKVVCAWLDGQARRLDFQYGVHDAGRVDLARALDVDPDEF